MTLDFNLYEISSFIRGIIYLWVAANAFSVAQLYRDGYIVAKRSSKIITSLTNVIYWISVLFLALSFAAFTVAFELVMLNKIVLSLLPFFAIPMGILLARFRKESITQQDVTK